MGQLRTHFFRGWIPIRRIAVLAHLHGGAAKFCNVASGRSWSLVLIRRDRTMPAVPHAERISMREAIDQADGPTVPTTNP
jgi:hypothetical protein